jgi:transglutaminase-like putative cysteine protease/5-hydroxyisourate hydrolase-like protein (transthyretin family)
MNVRNNSAFLALVIITIIVAAFLLSVAMASLPSLGTIPDKNADLSSEGNQTNHIIDPSEGKEGNEKDDSTTQGAKNCCIPCEGSVPSNELLLEIFGKTHTNYLRTTVATQYEGNEWTIGPDIQNEPFFGQYIPQEISSYTAKNPASVTIEITNQWSGFLPVIYRTNTLNLENIALSYYPNQQIFYTTDTLIGRYNVDFTDFDFSGDLLANSKLASQASSYSYLKIPDSLKNRVQVIIDELNLPQYTNSYSQITAIQNYLITNYKYDQYYTHAPSGQDPVEWFLFTEKRGVCANFNSAFVVLLRAAGIPSRMVSGFRISDLNDYQKVWGHQAHAWAEVKFDQIGWVEFDATGSGVLDLPSEVNVIQTTTAITFLSESATKGGTFTVRGDVTAANGAAPNGLNISIAILEDKNSVGLVCGKTTVTNGHFSLDCTVPTKIDVGNYNIVAKTLSGKGFKSSKSDPILTVNCETTISSMAIPPIYANKPVLLETQLTEKETQIPIENLPITLTYLTENAQLKTVTRNTNASGDATFTLDPSAPRAVINFTLSFNGANYYLPSVCQGNIEIPSIETMPSGNDNQSIADNKQIIFYASIPIALVVILGAVITVRKSKKSKNSFEKTSTPIHISSSKPTFGDRELDIAFPQITHPFPNVWGINETLAINVFLNTKTPSQGTLALKVKGIELDSFKIDNTQPVSFSLPRLIKGNNIIIAEYTDNLKEKFKAEREIRIVDYTEEIVAIYKDVFNQQKAKGVPLGEENTPREFQRINQEFSDSIDKQALEELVSLFEIADYSLAVLKREHYESMFLAGLKLKSSMEKAVENQK